jgi:hypothetical protein
MTELGVKGVYMIDPMATHPENIGKPEDVKIGAQAAKFAQQITQLPGLPPPPPAPDPAAEANLKLQLESFRERVKNAPGEVRIEHRPGYTGGGSLGAGFASILGLLLLARACARHRA